MTSRERIVAAMERRQPDRVPLMCQLSIGHYLLQCGVSGANYWLHNETIIDCFVALAERYGFDGILINLPGRPPNADDFVDRIEQTPEGEVIHWKRSGRCLCHPDDLPHEVETPRLALEEIDPDQVFYEDPHTLGGLKYPFYYDLEPLSGSGDDFFPPYLTAIIDGIVARVGDCVSVHSEVFSPFTQLMERLGYEEGLMALLTDPEKCHALLARFAAGASALATLQASRGVDAVLISSAFAGGGFISKAMYEEFVLLMSARWWSDPRRGVKAYTHTCGAIGDRLELMQATGIDGIDTMDPPRWRYRSGGCQAARRRPPLPEGNLDSVNVLLRGSVEECRERAQPLRAARRRRYILSSACSVAPRVPPANLLALREVVEAEGWY